MSLNLSDSRPIEILMVEDDEDDVVLTREGFEASKLLVNLHHVWNGEECMKFLRKQAPFTDVPEPDLMLLDLNMPVMDGREVLAELVADPALRHIPVIVLTTSTEAGDIEEMYQLRCNSYIPKPVDFDNFINVIRKFGDYWLTVVALPRR